MYEHCVEFYLQQDVLYAVKEDKDWAHTNSWTLIIIVFSVDNSKWRDLTPKVIQETNDAYKHFCHH